MIVIKNKDKIAIGEIKSTNFGSKFKYDPDSLFSDKKYYNRFLKDFGILQLSKTINDIVNNPSLVFENEVPTSNYELFPIIVFHDRMFQVPFANLVFQKLFLLELKKLNSNLIIPFNKSASIALNKVTIYPLSLIHSSDLEIMLPYLNTKKINLLDMLKKHFNVGHLVAPFYTTVHQYCNLEIIKFRERRIKNLFDKLEN